MSQEPNEAHLTFGQIVNVLMVGQSAMSEKIDLSAHYHLERCHRCRAEVYDMAQQKIMLLGEVAQGGHPDIKELVSDVKIEERAFKLFLGTYFIRTILVKLEQKAESNLVSMEEAEQKIENSSFSSSRYVGPAMSLPHDLSTAWVMRFGLELDWDELSQIMDYPEETVKALFQEAVRVVERREIASHN